MIKKDKKDKKTINIATDCSGIEAPIQAINKLLDRKYKNYKLNHIFSSEKDTFAIKSLLANYSPKILYTDMITRTNITGKNIIINDIIDIYICGFPCQPFSTAGKLLGENDKQEKLLFPYCIKTIKQYNPKLFILENVKNLKNNSYFSLIMGELKTLKNYNINIEILNTKDYGIPQNRERLFIIGIFKKNQIKSFEIPKVKPMKNIYDFFDHSNKKPDIIPNFCKLSIKESNSVFVDLSFVNVNSKDSYQFYSPTLTTKYNLWNNIYKRRATVKEYLMLQGFPTNFKQVVSKTQMIKQIGNSMSVNVLYYLLDECFKCVNF